MCLFLKLCLLTRSTCQLFLPTTGRGVFDNWKTLNRKTARCLVLSRYNCSFMVSLWNINFRVGNKRSLLIWSLCICFSSLLDLPEKGSGHWWSWARCCASPSHSQSGTLPGPCTEAGTSLHHMEGSSPRATDPGRLTGSWAATCWTQGLRQPLQALQHWHPKSLRQSPGACLCLDRGNHKKTVRGR